MTVPVPGTVIQVFSRAPVPGASKTRLIPELGPELAADLHRAMLWQTVETAFAAEPSAVELWTTPSTSHPEFDALRSAFPELTLRLQPAGDLGDRMYGALMDGLQTHLAAILVGTDCPGLTAEDLEVGASALTVGQDAIVLGPANDGGYYLIGASRCDHVLFEGIAWGTDNVLDATRSRLHELDWAYSLLPVRVDVDLPDDLHLYPGLLDSISNPKTRR